MSWDGSSLPLQTPNTPDLGPAAIKAKPWLCSRSLHAMQIPWAPRRSLRRKGRSGTWTAAAGLENPPERSPGFTFPRAAWESAARRPLAVPSAPAAAAAKSRQQEPRSLSPAPGHQAPPPGARLRLSTLADHLAEPRWPSRVCAPAAATRPLLLLPLLPPLS